METRIDGNDMDGRTGHTDTQGCRERDRFITDDTDGELSVTVGKDNKDHQSTKWRRCCTSCQKACLKFSSPFLAEGHKPEESSPLWQKVRYAFLCPPHGFFGRQITVVLLIVIVWTSGWSIVGDSMAPGGNLFSLLTLLISCHVAGHLVKLVRLPPLLGMLLMGGVLRNVPHINIANDIDGKWLISIRLVIGAVTPAVVVPCILSLAEEGYGVQKGIPTLVIAASSIDDVLAITGFSLTLGFVFGGGDLADVITRGPREVLIGIVCGIFYGIGLWYLPIKNTTNQRWLRLVLLLAGGLLFMFGSERAGIVSAGPIGCLTLAFVAAYSWRKENADGYDAVNTLIESVWKLAEPFMFGLIGAAVDVTTLDGQTAGLGIAVLAIGLVFRIVTSFLVVFGTDLTLREKLCIVFAWLPKATVQAAIGPVAYDKAVGSQGTDQEKAMGLQILTVAVLSIILTAPLGGVLIALTGPKLLSKSVLDGDEQATPDYPNEEGVVERSDKDSVKLEVTQTV